MAARTAGFAGADLANLVNEAALLAARHDKTAVEMKDFDEAIDRVIAGLEKKRVMSDEGAADRRVSRVRARDRRDRRCPGSIRCTRSRSSQRGFGALGYTMQLPLEDRYLMTRTDLLSQLAVLLGGRTAEEIAFGEISTGAQNDLQRATDIARAMVTEFGMSDLVGLVNHNGHRRNAFLETPFAQERGAYAEQTALVIDTEVKRILTEAHDEAAAGAAVQARGARHAVAAPARDRSRGVGRAPGDSRTAAAKSETRFRRKFRRSDRGRAAPAAISILQPIRLQPVCP